MLRGQGVYLMCQSWSVYNNAKGIHDSASCICTEEGIDILYRQRERTYHNMALTCGKHICVVTVHTPLHVTFTPLHRRSRSRVISACTWSYICINVHVNKCYIWVCNHSCVFRLFIIEAGSFIIC